MKAKVISFLKRCIVISLAISISFASVSKFSILTEASTNVVYLFGLSDSDFANRTSWMSGVSKYYTQSSTQPVTVKKKVLFSKKTLWSALKKCNILVIQTHGSSSKLKCISSNNEITYLTYNSIKKSTAKLSAKLVYLGACETASGSNNVASLIKSKGAKTVIGYSESVNTKCNSYAIKLFNKKWTKGNASVSAAMASATFDTLSKYGKYGNVDSYVIYGNSGQVYN